MSDALEGDSTSDVSSTCNEMRQDQPENELEAISMAFEDFRDLEADFEEARAKSKISFFSPGAFATSTSSSSTTPYVAAPVVRATAKTGTVLRKRKPIVNTESVSVIPHASVVQPPSTTFVVPDDGVHGADIPEPKERIADKLLRKFRERMASSTSAATEPSMGGGTDDGRPQTYC